MIVNRFNWLKTLKSEGKKYLSCTHYTSHSYFFLSPIYTLYIFLMFIEIPYKILNIWYPNTYKTTLYWHWRHNLPRQKFAIFFPFRCLLLILLFIFNLNWGEMKMTVSTGTCLYKVLFKYKQNYTILIQLTW